jgi:hypothetical protein
MMGEDLTAFAFKDAVDVSLFKPGFQYYSHIFMSRFFFEASVMKSGTGI